MAVVALVLLGILVWAVLWLPRHRGGAVRAALAQVLALFLTTSLSLLLVGLVLNRDNGWYTNWSDLPGTVPGSSTTHYTRGAHTRPAKPAELVTGRATALQAAPASNHALPGFNAHATGGQYLTVTIAGDASGIKQPALVWLPPSYASHPDRFYPVILGFHGIPGSPSAYHEKFDIGTTLTSLTAAKQLREAIVVVPTTFVPGNDSECVDGTTGPNPAPWETYVDTDVRNWVRTNLRTVDSPDAWATVGYSAGGFCAAMLPVRHPDHYSHGMVMSGYFAPEWTAHQQYLPTGDKSYDLTTIVGTHRPKAALWAYAARDDKQAMTALAGFTKAVRPPTTMETQTQQTGGHRWDVWLQGLPLGLQWLGTTDAQFAWRAA
ncbi:Enterochelin esterase [Raineyella antarctica]|uniref:Enterochelin esterase n=1 Tax=Raineyella antarctica TaxID=1577474 RepID=A0A1G6GFA3_9ACTN|nr:alpha/beta hydrolase-fold protein [Raineyella antarctica]SDB79826.1 Enterochelin esterase [Raineyella antarctica]